MLFGLSFLLSLLLRVVGDGMGEGVGDVRIFGMAVVETLSVFCLPFWPAFP